MESDITIQANSLLYILQNQLNILLAVLSRPVVLRQIFAFLAILLIAWLVPEGFHRWRQRRSAGEPTEADGSSRLQRWMVAAYHLVTPILALLLLHLSLWLFAQQGYPNGLLADMTSLIWLWLIYRALLTFLSARFGEAARPYEHRILSPIFLFLVILQITAIMPGSIAFGSATIKIASLTATLGNLISALIILEIG